MALIKSGKIATISHWNEATSSFDIPLYFNGIVNFNPLVPQVDFVNPMIDVYTKDIDTGRFLYDAAGKELPYVWETYTFISTYGNTAVTGYRGVHIDTHEYHLIYPESATLIKEPKAPKTLIKNDPNQPLAGADLPKKKNYIKYVLIGVGVLVLGISGYFLIKKLTPKKI